MIGAVFASCGANINRDCIFNSLLKITTDHTRISCVASVDSTCTELVVLKVLIARVTRPS